MQTSDTSPLILACLLALSACAGPVERSTEPDSGQSLSLVVEKLERQSGRSIAIAAGLRDRVLADIEGLPWRETLRQLARELDCAIDEVAGGALVLTRSAMLATGDRETIVRLRPDNSVVGVSRSLRSSSADSKLETTIVRLRCRISARALGERLAPRGERGPSGSGSKAVFPLVRALQAIVDASPEGADAVRYDPEINALLIRATPSTTRRLRFIIDAADRFPDTVELRAIRWARGSSGPRCLINGQVLEPGDAVRSWSGPAIPGLVLLGAEEGRAFFRRGEDLYFQTLPGGSS